MLGSGNDTDGFSDSNSNISAYRGFVLGNSNIVGSVDTGPYYGSVVGSNNKGNLLNSIVAGSQNTLAPTATSSDLASFLRSSAIFGIYHSVADSNSNLLISGYAVGTAYHIAPFCGDLVV